MPNLTIQGTTISFPDSGSSPNNAPAQVQFAELVTEALSAAVGTYDIAPQSYTLTADVNSNIDLTNLSFPTTAVRSAIISYNIERVTNSATQNETGTLSLVYNGTAWDVTRESTGKVLNVSNVPYVTFSVSNLGQVSFSSIALGGTFTSGKITYSAKALEN